MEAYTCNPSTQKTEAGGVSVWGKPGLHGEIQNSVGYIVRLSQNKQKNKNSGRVWWCVPVAPATQEA
jgi:hypothetical protein